MTCNIAACSDKTQLLMELQDKWYIAAAHGNMTKVPFSTNTQSVYETNFMNGIRILAALRNMRPKHQHYAGKSSR